MEIIQRVNNWQEIRDYCNEVKEIHATSEQAKCARGRKNFWLQAEPVYSCGKYREAVKDERLWQFCIKLFPQATLAQVYFADKNIGIDWHRDAAYCKPTARIFNLGNAIIQTKEGDKVETLHLTGGEVIEFNSKVLHKGTPLDSDRVGIGMWQDKIDIKNPENWIK